jgi:hypothetical protein
MRESVTARLRSLPIWLAALAHAPLLLGQSPAAGWMQPLQKLIDERLVTIGRWESEANFQIYLTIGIIVFGAAVGILQAYKRDWCKVATMVLGATISVMTGVNTKVFDADYRALQRSAAAARTVIRNLEATLSRYDPTQSAENLDALRAEFMKEYGKIDDIETKLLSLRTEPLLPRTTVVYAQSKPAAPPSWVANPPVDKLSYYFVGISDNTDLTAAKTESANQAAEKAAQALMGSRGQPSAQFRDLIHQSANVADTWFSYDSRTRVYHYCTLLRLSRAVSAAGFDKGTQTVAGTYRLMLSSVDIKDQGGAGAIGWRFECRLNGSVIANIPPRDYDNKEKSVQLPWQPVPVAAGQKLAIEVTGYRTAGRITAHGTTSVTFDAASAAKPISVAVVNAVPARGSFTFNFSIAKESQ